MAAGTSARTRWAGAFERCPATSTPGLACRAVVRTSAWTIARRSRHPRPPRPNTRHHRRRLDHHTRRLLRHPIALAPAAALLVNQATLLPLLMPLAPPPRPCSAAYTTTTHTPTSSKPNRQRDR